MIMETAIGVGIISYILAELTFTYIGVGMGDGSNTQLPAAFIGVAAFLIVHGLI